MKKIFITMMLCIASVSASQKIYIDDEQLDHKQDCFRIHQGNNIWLETKTVHRDATGLFTFENNLLHSKKSTEYVKRWKCPYCYMFWPIGTACQNPDCPSKYKFG